jgi:uncharacterized membrane protein YccC
MQIERPLRGTRYEDDYAMWAEEQAAALAAGRFADLDLVNLADEVGDLSRSLDHALTSHLKVLLAYLLEREFQPERATRSWELTERDQADDIEELLRQAPSRRPRLKGMIPAAYRRARRLAARETRLSPDMFSERPSQRMLAGLHDALERAKREAASD